MIKVGEQAMLAKSNYKKIVQKNFLAHRKKTRKQRYAEKMNSAQFLPISIGCVNFMHDGNLAFLIRSAVCFGVKDIHVIGSIPARSELRRLSGSTCDFINLIQHSSPGSFNRWAEENSVQVVAAELCDKSKKLRNYRFNFDKEVCIFTGHETSGVPVDVTQIADCVEIDMPGPGFCLNTSQAANIVLYEASKQYLER